jgi:hypothetical protein
MKRLFTLALMTLAFAATAAPASGAFGLHNLDTTFTAADGSPAMEAGTHPYAWTIKLDANTVGEAGEIPEEVVKSLIIDQPAGLVVDPSAVPTCSAADFAIVNSDANTNCPDASAVGFAEAKAIEGVDSGAIYNLVPSRGSAAKLGLHILGAAVTIEAGLRPEGERSAYAAITNIPQAEPFFGSVATIWGNPFAKAHDSQRGRCLIVKGSCPVASTEKAFVTMPTRCTGPLVTLFKADSWQNPGAFFEGQATTHDNSEPPLPLGTTDCGKVGFDPHIAAAPTSAAAESASGLSFDLEMEDEGLEDPKGTAAAHISKAVVTLPEGVSVNPSQAEGLGACSEAAFKAEAADSEPGQGCPQSSKVGTIEVTTPLLEEALDGSIYVAEPYKNPFNSLIALYMVIRNRERGIVVRLPAKVTPDPLTGQLTTTVEDLPQQPFSHFHFQFHEGARSPLVTPPTCGEYQTKAVLTPDSGGAPITTLAPFKITSGVAGGPCPSGVAPFNPGFQAGSADKTASAYSPFLMRLTRADGEQALTRFDAVLPAGVAGKLAGIPQCPDAAIAAAKAKTGIAEREAPSCPAASQVGRVLGGAGVGPELTYVPGKAYLAGPFGGAPLSIAVITPVVAGPFDAGTVVIREALDVDPLSAQVQADGAKSDPIPRILQGIPLKVRDVRVYIDRPGFTFNASGCEAKSTVATIFGAAADAFSPADDVPVSKSAYYQASDCGHLDFKPRLSLNLKGGTKRNDHPAFHSAVTYPYPSGPGYSNIGRAVVTLPPSEFIDNAHINNPCTRVQFNAHACPKSSILGKAKATTPILADPLEGPVYFRSNGGERLLPDIVAELNGQFRVVLVGFVDSKGGRIRTTFATVPDAPVKKFTIDLFGGKRGLLVNSTNLCAQPRRAGVRLTAQSGKRHNFDPLVKTSCKGSAPQRRSR